ncbi:DUF2158 domain-containing protein [Massilia genomosp. 1]|uniref:DUF2158 domain-containing protein n=1 Tax=Massilia genomosp. 1 TaxID=2609280 RepID=A0ABX0MIN3_9BURK|nr:DUF2158 domain-containing protein [Massilia genomosp. 1]NIA00098.1 DUF2158 domain-containing protein [Massilia sp. CCM 8734]
MNQQAFGVDQLVVCYSPPNLRSVMPGNKVMLRSGGPEMTVCDTSVHGQAVCQWTGDDGLVTRAFDLECLTCYGAR